MSTSTFRKTETIDKLYIKTANGSIDLLSLWLAASVGGFATARVTTAVGTKISDADKRSTTIGPNIAKKIAKIDDGDYCSVYIRLDNRDIEVFRGRVSGTAKAVQTSSGHAQVRYNISLAQGALFKQSIPPTHTALITNVSNASIVNSGFTFIGNLTQHLSDEDKAQFHINVADFACKMIDGVCYSDKDRKNHEHYVAGTGPNLAEVVDTKSCPSMAISSPAASEPIAAMLSDAIIESLDNGASYWSTFMSIISNFFLTIVPAFGDDKVKVLPHIPWRKKISHTFKTSDITGYSEQGQTLSASKIDGVIVGYSRLQTQSDSEPDLLEGQVVFGESPTGDGKVRAITNPEELISANAMVPKSYITRMVPSWVSHFAQPTLRPLKGRTRVKSPQDKACTKAPENEAADDNFELNWASLIARSTYAELNRRTAMANLNVRLDSALDAFKHIGHVVSYKPAPDMLNADNNDEDMVGYLNAVNLTIAISPSQLAIQAQVAITHVRTKSENDVLGIEDCIYVDNW